MNQSYGIDRSVSDISFSVMTERFPSVYSNTFPIKKEIPASILKQLIDKSYDKRKLGGYELHNFLTTYAEKGNLGMLKNVIDMFKVEYLDTSVETLKKAGLMAYSAMASNIASHADFGVLLESLLIPVIELFRDSDSKIRYAAVETMYNISKICRIQVLDKFDIIFKSMSELFADTDSNVKKAIEKLDLLLKTLVVECEANLKVFNSIKFMNIIREMLIGSTNIHVQKSLVSWIIVLDSIPNFSIISYLPNYLEGIFLLLGSKQDDVRKTAYGFLKDLLSEIMQSLYGELDLLFVLDTMAKFASHSNEAVRGESINWILNLLEKSDKVLLKIFPNVLQAVIQCLADTIQSISDKAIQLNAKLIKFFNSNKETPIIQYEKIVEILILYINCESKVTRQSVLDWVITLQANNPESIKSKLEILLETLSCKMFDSEESIIDSVLKVLCKIAEYKGYFDKVMNSVLNLFSQHPSIIEGKGGVIITYLCTNLGTEIVYKSLAIILSTNFDKQLTNKMIPVLNDLILTDNSFENLRERLKYCLDKQDTECIEFFEILFKTWCHNPTSALSLTFLVQAYELSYEILHIV